MSFATVNRRILAARSLKLDAQRPESDRSLKWSYFVGQSEGKAKVDSDWF